MFQREIFPTRVFVGLQRQNMVCNLSFVLDYISMMMLMVVMMIKKLNRENGSFRALKLYHFHFQERFHFVNTFKCLQYLPALLPDKSRNTC